jgi:hypothetical protein
MDIEKYMINFKNKKKIDLYFLYFKTLKDPALMQEKTRQMSLQ